MDKVSQQELVNEGFRDLIKMAATGAAKAALPTISKDVIGGIKNVKAGIKAFKGAKGEAQELAANNPDKIQEFEVTDQKEGPKNVWRVTANFEVPMNNGGSHRVEGATLNFKVKPPKNPGDTKKYISTGNEVPAGTPEDVRNTVNSVFSHRSNSRSKDLKNNKTTAQENPTTSPGQQNDPDVDEDGISGDEINYNKFHDIFMKWIDEEGRDMSVESMSSMMTNVTQIYNHKLVRRKPSKFIAKALNRHPGSTDPLTEDDVHTIADTLKTGEFVDTNSESDSAGEDPFSNLNPENLQSKYKQWKKTSGSHMIENPNSIDNDEGEILHFVGEYLKQNNMRNIKHHDLWRRALRDGDGRVSNATIQQFGELLQSKGAFSDEVSIAERVDVSNSMKYLVTEKFKIF